MSLTFKEYQEEAVKTANYPIMGHGIVYPTIGLAGETGEISEKVKKLFRDNVAFKTTGKIPSGFRDDLCKELGDVLWYISEVARQADISLEEVAYTNIVKLADRKERNMINGNGDNR